MGQLTDASNNGKRPVTKSDDKLCSCGKKVYCKRTQQCRSCYDYDRYWNQGHRERIAKQFKEKYTAAKERYKRYQSDSYQKVRREVIEILGGKCACCGESRLEFLAVDHVGGGGREHRRQVGKAYAFYRSIREREHPEIKLRVLCHNCNQSLGWYGYCPHTKENL